jgi:hypothetical protein
VSRRHRAGRYRPECFHRAFVALLAWLVFPLLALAICVGIGLLAERAAGVDLPAALLPALGFGAAIVVLGPLCATGAGGALAAIVLVVLAAAGYAVAAMRVHRGGAWAGAATRVDATAGRAGAVHAFGLAARLRPGAGAFAGAAVYGLYIAPVALSGQVSFLGYNLLNDTAIHLALVDWIGNHGSRSIVQAPSSYGATINDYVGTHYPLGSHELLAALKPLVGLDPARIYQPFLAFSAAVAAGAVYVLARRGGLSARLASAAAIAALGSELVFSFSLQGGIKELSFIACLAGAAALAAYDVRLMALPAAALYAIYGVYALPWIAPLALVALWVARPTMRTAFQSIAIFVVAIAVLVPDSISYYRHGHNVITSGSELGPLADPLSPLQAAGIWLGGDYRFTPTHAWITYALAAVTVALALCGLLRRERSLLLLAVPALIAFAVTAPASSPYIDAKLLAILSPAVLLAAVFGLAALPLRRAAFAAALVLGVALLVSDALAYRMALVAPVDRLNELGAIDKRFAGRGPILVNEYEEYTKHYMRRSRGSDPYEGWSAGRAELRDRELPVGGHSYDLDQLRTSFIERWPLIALRRSPAESVPPSNFRRVWSGRFYEVWQRVAPQPLEHLALGHPPYDPTAALPCGVNGTALLRPKPLIVPIGNVSPLPAGWSRDVRAGTLVTNKGGRIAVEFQAQGPVHVWLRGSAFRKLQVLIDGQPIGSVRELNGPNQWMDVGLAQLAPGAHRLELVRPTRSLRPGDAQHDEIGPFALVSADRPRRVRGGALRHACGQPADWLDILGR